MLPVWTSGYDRSEFLPNKAMKHAKIVQLENNDRASCVAPFHFQISGSVVNGTPGNSYVIANGYVFIPSHAYGRTLNIEFDYWSSSTSGVWGLGPALDGMFAIGEVIYYSGTQQAQSHTFALPIDRLSMQNTVVTWSVVVNPVGYHTIHLNTSGTKMNAWFTE